MAFSHTLKFNIVAFPSHAKDLFCWMLSSHRRRVTKFNTSLTSTLTKTSAKKSSISILTHKILIYVIRSVFVSVFLHTMSFSCTRWKNIALYKITILQLNYLTICFVCKKHSKLVTRQSRYFKTPARKKLLYIMLCSRCVMY